MPEPLIVYKASHYDDDGYYTEWDTEYGDERFVLFSDIDEEQDELSVRDFKAIAALEPDLYQREVLDKYRQHHGRPNGGQLYVSAKLVHWMYHHASANVWHTVCRYASRRGWSDDQPTMALQGAEEMTPSLFKVKKEDLYGTQIAKDSQGRIVLELKGGAGVRAFAEKDLEEVKPYTVAVEFVTNPGRVYHYTAEQGQVSKGDLVFVDVGGTRGLAYVDQINTKSDRATKALAGRVYKSKPLS